MATAFCSRHLYRPVTVRFRQSIPTKRLHVPNSSRKPSRLLRNIQAQQHNKTDSIDAQRFMELLYEDLQHIFDEQGIDKSMYDDRIKFRDPITKYDSIDGYLFNIWMLKVLFQPEFQLHSLKQTEPNEIRIRWTTVMKFIVLPWKPELVLTGESIMAIDPETRKFCSHVDTWDCIENNNYFSLEGLLEVLKQLSPVGTEPVPLQICKATPDLDTPKYQILKRTANYEVRKYSPSSVVESRVDKLSGCGGFNNFTRLLTPNGEDVKIIETGGGIAAVKRFSGIPADEEVKRIEKDLRAFLQKDGLKPRKGISTFVMIEDLVSTMQTYWPTLACPSGDGEKFWAHEWEKHGTCSEGSIPDQHSYFLSALTLYKKSDLLKALTAAGIEPDDGFYSVNSIKSAIKKAIGFTPGLECNRDESGKNQLSEVYLCADTSGENFIECPTFPRISCRNQVQFPSF